MKRSTALKNLDLIITRLHHVNGIIGTPKYNYDFVWIKRAWVFGSVAKGSESPNDLDIFIEVLNEPKKLKYYSNQFKHTDRFTDKTSHGMRLKHAGIIKTKDAIDYAIKWLRQDTRKISVHVVGDDEIFSELDIKYLIYPRNDFKKLKDQ